MISTNSCQIVQLLNTKKSHPAQCSSVIVPQVQPSTTLSAPSDSFFCSSVLHSPSVWEKIANKVSEMPSHCLLPATPLFFQWTMRKKTQYPHEAPATFHCLFFFTSLSSLCSKLSRCSVQEATSPDNPSNLAHICQLVLSSVRLQRLSLHLQYDFM